MNPAHKHVRILASNRAKRRLLDSPRLRQRSHGGDAFDRSGRNLVAIKRSGSQPFAKGRGKDELQAVVAALNTRASDKENSDGSQ